MDHEPIEPPPILVEVAPDAPPVIPRPWSLGNVMGISAIMYGAIFILSNIIAIPFAILSVFNLYTSGKMFSRTTTTVIDDWLDSKEISTLTNYLKKQVPDTDFKVEAPDNAKNTVITMTARKGKLEPEVLEPAIESGLSKAGITLTESVRISPTIDSPSMSVMLSDPWIIIGGAVGFQLAIIAVWQFTKKKLFIGERALPPFHTGSKLKAILIGTFLGLGVSFLANGVDDFFRSSLSSTAPSIWEPAATYPLWAQIAIILVGAIGAPILEELFFRGMLIGLFQKVGRPWLGVVLSGVVFGISHFQDISTILTITIMGFLLGAAYVKTKSIYTTIAMHMVNNMISFGILFFGKH